MKLDQKTIEFIVSKLTDFYCNECTINTRDYDFGFFDAFHIVEDLKEKAGFNK